MDTVDYIIDFLNKEIKLHKISFMQLADRTELTQPGINKILKGRSDHRLSSVIKLLHAIGYEIIIIKIK